MPRTIMMIAALLICLPFEVSAKNVILFIGDGMGPGTVTAARFYKDPSGNNILFMDSLQLAAHVMTRSADHIVTDSAAAVTAMATGVRGPNNCLGLGVNCNKRYETIAEMALKEGMSVGVVTTTRITHATPAGFYAHIKDRDSEREIMEQLLGSNVTVALGGGSKFFTPKLAKEKKYLAVEDVKEMVELPPDAKVIGLFSDSHIPYVIERKKNGYKGPGLVEMTEAAIRHLSKNPKGYFLMVEGGRIDHAAHDNLAKEMFEELLEFDDAIKSAANITDGKRTVILVTADHECGGTSINGYPKLGTSIFGNGGRQNDGKSYPILTWATGRLSKYSGTLDPDDPKKIEAAHTAMDVPLYAAGLSRNITPGTIENTRIFDIMRDELFDRH